MDRSEIMELRRLFKTYREESCPVNGFSRGFIDAEGNIKTCGSMPDFHTLKNMDVKKRVFTLASKTISNNSVTVPVSYDALFLFEKLNAEKGKNPELFLELCERIAKAIKVSGDENPYAVHLLSYTYDPPAKTSDHRTIIDGVSDEIYTFFVAMVLPVKTSRPSYGYWSEQKMFVMNPTQKVVDNPVCGFVYPDFTDRTSNTGSVLYFRTDKMDISEALFGKAAPPLPEKEKKSVAPPVTSETKEQEDAMGEPSDADDDIPSLDTGSMSMEEVRGRDIVAEKASEAEMASVKGTRDADRRENISPVVKREGKKHVRISGDTLGLAKRLVDGVWCYVVPVSDAELEA